MTNLTTYPFVSMLCFSSFLLLFQFQSAIFFGVGVDTHRETKQSKKSDNKTDVMHFPIL